jgi:hypothetical protein
MRLTLSYTPAAIYGRDDFKTVLLNILLSSKNLNFCTTVPLCIGCLVKKFQSVEASA